MHWAGRTLHAQQPAQRPATTRCCLLQIWPQLLHRGGVGTRLPCLHPHKVEALVNKEAHAPVLCRAGNGHCVEGERREDLRPVITPSSVSITRSIAPLSSAPLGIHRVLRPAITRSSVRKASVPTGSHTSIQPRAVRREAQIDDTAPRIVLPSTLSSSLQHIRSQSLAPI